VRSQDARADKIGKVEGIEEGWRSLFVSKYTHDVQARTHGGRGAGRKQMSHRNDVLSLVFLVVCIV